MHLALFFTRGVSLRTWDEAGILEREASLYLRFKSEGISSSFITYGDVSDLSYADRIPGIEILCNRWGLPAHLYEIGMPLLHARRLLHSDVIKTTQTSGAHTALCAAYLWHKPLIVRCGYMWSLNAARQHGPNSRSARLGRWLEFFAFNLARRIVVTAPAMQCDIVQRFPRLDGRVIVIPNYVDTGRFYPKPDEQRQGEVIFVGRLSAEKNLSALLEAIQPLDVNLTVIGNGPLRAELESRFSLGDRVCWQGNVPNQELPRYLNRSCLFVLPSLYEGHPKAIIEAMACGVPVIGADSPGIRDLIHHGETGWLCDTDSNSIRLAIQEMMAQPLLRDRLARNALQYVWEHFALDRILKIEIELLRQVAQRER
jgi:glycosyltransferase involved in cell wall biosynthesis